MVIYGLYRSLWSSGGSYHSFKGVFIVTIGGSGGSSGIFSESLRAFSGPLGALDVIIGTSASGGCLEVSVLGDYVPLVGHLGPSCWKFGASSGSLGPPVGH